MDFVPGLLPGEEPPSESTGPSVDLSEVMGVVPSTQGAPVDLTPDVKPQTVAMEIAKVQAVKAHIALGKFSPGIDQLTNDIASGAEGPLRELTVDRVASENQQVGRNLISDFAKKNGGQITPEQIAYVQQLKEKNPTAPPGQILEQGFGEAFTSTIINMKPESQAYYTKSVYENPDLAQHLIDMARDWTWGRDGMARELSLLHNHIEDQGIASKVWDYTKQILGSPYYSWIGNRNAINLDANPVMPGDSVEAQRNYLMSLPPQQRIETYGNALREYAKGNPIAAAAWGQAMLSFSSSDQAWGNINGVLDALLVGQVGTAAGKVGIAAAKNVSGTYQMGKYIANAMNGQASQSLSTLADKTGDAIKASQLGATKVLLEEAGQTPIGSAPAIGEALSPILNVTLGPGTGASATRTARLTDVLRVMGQSYLVGMTSRMRPTMDVYKEIQAMLPQAEEVLKRTYNMSQDTWMATDIVYHKTSNSYHWVGDIGTPTGQYFESNAAAYNFGKNVLGLSDEAMQLGTTATEKGPVSVLTQKKGASALDVETGIVQQGTGWKIRVTSPVDTTKLSLSDWTLPTDKTAPTTAFNWLFRKLGNASQQLSKIAMQNRQINDFTGNEIRRFAEERMAVYEKISPASREAIDKVNTESMTAVGTERRGVIYNNDHDLTSAFLQSVGRAPSEDEKMGYYLYHQMMGAEWALRNFSKYRDWSRAGYQQFAFKVRKQGAEESVKSDWLLGKSVETLPSDTNKFNILYNPPGGGSAQHYQWSELTGATGRLSAESIKADIASGRLRAIQVAKPTELPLAEASGFNRPVHFVVTAGHEARPLPHNLVDYNPGAHVMYPHNYRIVQPVMHVGDKGLTSYMGDKTMTLSMTDKDGADVARRLDGLRLLYKNGASDQAISDYITKNLPENKKYWDVRWKDQGLNTEMPIRHIPIHGTYFQSHPQELSELMKRPNFSNEWDSPFNPGKNFDRAFTQERNKEISTIHNLGSNDMPLWQFQKADDLKPMEALRLATNQAIGETYMGDMQTEAIESFARQFGHLADDIGKAKSNPWEFFWHPRWNEGAQGEAANQLTAAKLAWARHQQYMGVQPKTVQAVSTLRASVASAFESIGLEKLSIMVAENQLPGLKDTAQFTRNALFFRNFAFNPMAFLQQASGMANNLAIANPKSAMPGMAAGFHSLHWELASPEVRQGLNNFAKVWGWKREDFLDAVNHGFNNGFFKVGNEQAWRTTISGGDSMLGQALANGWNKVSNVGSVFFNGGESLTRRTAWMSASHEWLTQNPGLRLTDQAIKEYVMPRASLMSSQMTKAFQGELEQGFKGVPLWYTTYSRRIFEQYWGGQLTAAEKLRLFTAHSMLYGVPAAATGGTLLWPISESIKKEALERGYNTNTAYFQAFQNGFLSAGLSIVGGGQYDVGGQMGVNPITQVKDIIDVVLGKKDASGAFIAGLVGPLGRTETSMVQSLAPVVWYINSKINPWAQGADSYPLTLNNLNDIAREIRGYDAATKLWFALNYHAYFAKHSGAIQATASTTDGLMSLFGMDPIRLKDQQIMIGTNVEWAERQKTAMKMMETAVSQGQRALSEGDQKSADAYFMQAQSWAVGGALSSKQVTIVHQRVSERAGVVQTQPETSRFLGESGTPEQLKQRNLKGTENIKHITEPMYNKVGGK